MDVLWLILVIGQKLTTVLEMAARNMPIIVSNMEVDGHQHQEGERGQEQEKVQAQLEAEERKEEEDRVKERQEEQIAWDVAMNPGEISYGDELYQRLLEMYPGVKEGKIPQKLLYTGDKLLRAIHFCREDCEYGGFHPRFAIWSLENQPVQFQSHRRGETAIYTYVRQGEVRKPFRVPEPGETLMSGVKWHTTRPKMEKAALMNSCGLDGFLTDLKLRSLDYNVCFECLFRHEGTSGRNLENILRTLISHIFVFAKSETGKLYQQIRKFTKEQDLFLKRVWLDDNGFRIMKKKFYNSAGEIFEAEDLLFVNKGDEEQDDGYRNFSFGNTRISMQYILMEQLHQICQVRVYFHCSCMPSRKGNAKIQVFGEGVQPLIHPAYGTFNTEVMRFDEDFALAEQIRMGLDPTLRVNEAPLAKRIDQCECPSCEE